MDPWSVGLVAVIAVGLAVIVFGALWDRARNRRAAAEMLAPPTRHIPQFRPDSRPPSYLSELQARRLPDRATSLALTPAEREELARQVKESSTVTLDAGYVSSDFVTDPTSGQAVLDDPAVLLCAEPVDSVRELVPVLEKCLLARRPLVVVAPALSDEVRGTLEVNQIRQTMRLLAVILPANDVLRHVAHVTGAEPRSRSDLQSGYVWPEHLGHCARWVSSSKRSHVIGAATLTTHA